jgi:lipopolysaccharide transport system ATP-binding protein
MGISDEVLMSVQGVSKKFCRSLKRSLWYGMQDIVSELNPFESHTSEVNVERHSILRKDEFWAVNDVSFELRRGECLGLIGRNGAGKTTLLKMLNGLMKPDQGRIEIRGRVGALIALGAGFNPILTGRENIYVNGSVLGLTKREIDEKIEGIIDFADIREFIDSPVQSYSSGMQVRLGFAVATALEPDILLLDEVVIAGFLN